MGRGQRSSIYIPTDQKNKYNDLMELAKKEGISIGELLISNTFESKHEEIHRMKLGKVFVYLEGEMMRLNKIDHYILENFMGDLKLMREHKKLLIDKKNIIKYLTDELERLSEDEILIHYFGMDSLDELDKSETITVDEIIDEIKDNIESFLEDNKQYFDASNLSEGFLLKRSQYLLQELLKNK